jgi:hypothetical protein
MRSAAGGISTDQTLGTILTRASWTALLKGHGPGAQNFPGGEQHQYARGAHGHGHARRRAPVPSLTPEAAFDAVSPSSFRLLIYEYGYYPDLRHQASRPSWSMQPRSAYGYYPDLELDVAPVEELSGCDFVLEVESAGGTLKDAGAAALNDFVLATSVDL